ncbi:thioesterase family protein [Sphingomonas sp. 2SG]|uniref:acyl-CoA thioesterase n=1 Tax=Sphingomonas sp. 2SG TaxID=2502201 RepID=UPI00148534D1|nr:thioesterase family protein [Sphingomonas sp. 2SG]
MLLRDAADGAATGGVREGFAFATRFRVRYAEIDGQKVVFNSRYLEYADVAATEFWAWTGIGTALGPAWEQLEFHVRKAEVDYLRPFVWGDTVAAHVRIARVGGTSMTMTMDLAHGTTGDLHATVSLVMVNVHLPTGRPAAIPEAVRAFLKKL